MPTSTTHEQFTAEMTALADHFETMAADIASLKSDLKATNDKLAKAHTDLDEQAMKDGIAALKAMEGKLDALHAGMKDTAAAVPTPPEPAPANAGAAPETVETVAEPAPAPVHPADVVTAPSPANPDDFNPHDTVHLTDPANTDTSTPTAKPDGQ